MTQRIRFFVSDSGEIALDLSGFEGDSCKTYAADFKKNLAELGVHLDLEEMRKKEEETEVRREKNVIER